MKIFRTKLMRLTGKKYLFFFGVLFTAPKALVTGEDLNHEKIHSEQFIEMTIASLAFLGVLSLFLNNLLFLLSPFIFYAWYALEWLIGMVKYNNRYMAYRNVSFEREAYQNEGDLDYLEGRKVFANLKYL